MENEVLKNSLVVFAKLQSLMHDVERMIESGTKREIKQRLNNFQNWLEPVISKTSAMFNQSETVLFTEFTTKIDQLSLELKLKISDEL